MISKRPINLALVLAIASLPSPAMSMMSPFEAAQMLEKAYVNDCIADLSPHGYYGAFLQPCEFTFWQAEESHFDLQEGGQDVCSDDIGNVVAKPVPIHWFFNFTDHFRDKDWDDMSSDDFDEVADNLMLWPDQCVGVQPRCYSVQDPAIRDTLTNLFDNKLPTDATHIKVDCRNDAMELSRAVYSFAHSFEKSLPTLILWALTVVLLSLVAFLWCCYACFRLCVGRRQSKIVVTTPIIRTDYMSVEDSKECEMLLRKDYGSR